MTYKTATMKLHIICLFITSLFILNSKAQVWKKIKSDKTDTTQNSQPVDEEKKKGSNVFQKVVSKVSKGAANLGGGITGTASSIADLDAVEPMIYFYTNLVQREIGTMDMDFFGNWKTGGDMVGVMFLPKDKSFFYKLDGTVKFDGIKADYQSAGLYTQMYDVP
jgi:hypothetical protein